METQQLWYHKYQPKKIQDYHFHQPIMKRLIRYAEHDNVLNMLIYGPPGSGKYTLAMSLLYYLLEKYPDRDCIYQKKLITVKDQEYHIFQSKYHFD